MAKKFITHMPVKRHLMISPVIEVIYIVFYWYSVLCEYGF